MDNSQVSFHFGAPKNVKCRLNDVARERPFFEHFIGRPIESQPGDRLDKPVHCMDQPGSIHKM